MASWLKFLTGPESPKENPILTASAEENEEWLRHLATRNPVDRKAGSSINEEYQAWLIKRAKSRTAEQRALERAMR
jgi:hypothetical protein